MVSTREIKQRLQQSNCYSFSPLLGSCAKFNLSPRQLRIWFFSSVLFLCKLYRDWLLPMPSLYCYRNKIMRPKLIYLTLIKIGRRIPTDFSRTSSCEGTLRIGKDFYYLEEQKFEDILAKHRLLTEDWLPSQLNTVVYF